MSLCLFSLVLITAHLAPADGKYAHHLWLMHGYKIFWRKARRHNDKRQNLVMVIFSFFCINKEHGMTFEATCLLSGMPYSSGDILGTAIMHIYMIFYIQSFFIGCREHF